MQVVADEVPGNTSNLVANSTEAKLLGEGLSLGRTGGRNGCFDEAVLVSVL